MISGRYMKTERKNVFNPYRHICRLSLRTGAVPGVAGMASLLLLIMANLYIGFGQGWQDSTIFLMQIMDTPESYILLLTLWGMLQTIFMFRFLFSRKASDLYFSLGIRRTQLFRIRFLTGAAWLAAAILFVAVVVTVFNLFLSAYAAKHIGQTIAQSIWVAASFILTALLGYALTTLVGVLSGSVSEFLVCCLAVLTAPLLLIWAGENLLSVFLWGNTLSVRGIWNYFLPGERLLDWLAMNPLLLMARLIEPSAVGYLPASPLPPAAMLPVWLAVLAGCCLAARIFFIRRRTERTGSRGACKPLGLVLLFPVLAAFASGPLYRAYMNGISRYQQAAGLGIILSAAVFFVAAYWFGWLRQESRKYLLAFPAYLAIIGLCILVLLTGGLGYAGHRPDADTIERVHLSYKGIPALVVRNLYARPTDGLVRINYNRDLTLTDPNDIQLALDLHQIIIDQRDRQENLAVQTGTLVRYTLKNGGVVTRYYPRLDTTSLESMLALDQTEAFRSLLTGYLNGLLPAKDPDRFRQQVESPLAAGALYFASPLADEAVLINEPAAAQIRQALLRDLLSQTLGQRYRPAAAEHYVLYFYSIRHQQQTSWQPLMSRPELDWGYSLSIAVDAASPATLALLRDITAVPENKPIEWILNAGAYWDHVGGPALDRDHAACFLSYSLTEENLDRCLDTEGNTAERVTDPAQINTLYAASRHFCFAGDNGSVIFIKLAGSDVLIARYVPRDAGPDGQKISDSGS